MSRNKLSTKFKATPDKIEWNEICPPNEYRVLEYDEANSKGLIPEGMDDINQIIVGASGSLEDTIMYFANYCRIDHDTIDQEPYIELYESGSLEPCLHGILHHAKFEGRSEVLSTDDINRIAASGSSVDIQFTAKPENISGSLDDLRKEGKITGFSYAWNQGMRKKDST